MIKPAPPPNEAERLFELNRYGVLDTLPEEAYDAITYLASQICDTPIALISLVDAHRQWFKSRVGLDVPETPREVAFCAHAIQEPTELLIVNDARNDPRFAENPFVLGDPSIRFYAGAPLETQEGNALGTLCVIDREPRELEPSQEKALRALATQVMALLELRLAVDLLKENQEELQEVMRQREALIATVSHEIRTPLTAVLAYIEILNDSGPDLSEKERREIRDRVSRQAGDLSYMVEDLLVAARAEAGSLDITSVRVNLRAQAAQVLEGLNVGQADEVHVEGEPCSAMGDPNRVRQVVRNLLTNAFRYGGPKVAVRLESDAQWCHLMVVDDGPPIPEADREQIFEAYGRSSGKHHAESVGLGLSISRLLTEKMGGTLTYRHEDGLSVFDAALPIVD